MRARLDKYYPQQVVQSGPGLEDLIKCTIQIPLPGRLADPEFHRRVGPARLQSGELTVSLSNMLVRLLFDTT